jgi:heme oxygenase
MGVATAILKAATAKEHVQVERRMNESGAFADLATYRRLLKEFHLLYASIEPSLCSAWEALELPCRKRSSQIALDLECLGYPAASESISAPVIGLSEQLGCLYVLEGSTLGGQIIARELENRLGLTPATGAAFFRGAGRETAAHWRAFSDALDRVWPRVDEGGAIEGARRTFAAFDQAIQNTSAAGFNR